jgi:hypothetical protein
LSTLTKILIVLLTISSIFLCGIVVAYVGSADNYKEAFESRKNEVNRLRQSEQAKEKELNDAVNKFQERENELNQTIKSLQGQTIQLKTELADAKRSRDDAIQRLNNWAGITEDFQKTNQQQGEMLKKALAEVVQLNASQDHNQKELQDRALAILEKMALIDQLEKESRRLREQNTELQKKLDQLTQQYGKTVSIPAPVTQITEKAQAAPPVTNIGLKGVINDVNMVNSWAEISIGSADGVRNNMTFHVTRNGKFICDIVIFSVDTDKAIGKLELVQETPKVGDLVSTNL